MSNGLLKTCIKSSQSLSYAVIRYSILQAITNLRRPIQDVYSLNIKLVWFFRKHMGKLQQLALLLVALRSVASDYLILMCLKTMNFPHQLQQIGHLTKLLVTI